MNVTPQVHACAVTRCERSTTRLLCSKHFRLVPEFWRRKLARARRGSEIGLRRLEAQVIRVVEEIEAQRQEVAR